jgi:hypothetical protein
LPLYTIKHGECTCAKRGSCTHPGKHPRTPNGVKDATTDRDRIKEWTWSDANIGIATGRSSGIIVLDVDGDGGVASLEALQAEHGRLPKTVTVKTGNGRHYYFRCDGDVHIGNSVHRLGEGIDVRGDGGYVVGAGSVHVSGFTYRFVKGRGPDDIEVAQAPKWLLSLVTAKAVASREVELVAIPPEKLDRAKTYADAALHRELERLGKAPMHQRNHTLNIAAFKLGQLMPYGILDPAVVTQNLGQTARDLGLDESEIEPTIASGLNAGRQHPRRLPFLRSDQQTRTVEPPRKSDEVVTKQLAELGETDTDNAQRFANRFGTKVISTPGHGWLVFDGRRWRQDDVGQVIELAKETARLIADESVHLQTDDARAARSRFAEQSLGKGSLDRMVDLAKSLLAVEDARLDADPWLLNVENGTIDLKTGRRERHDPRDLLTKIAPVRADRSAKCPLFKKFLKRITGDDVKLRSFIQKAHGYSLTGITSEQVFFFIHGKSGENGKSTLVNLNRDMLGDYGKHTPTDTLLTKQYDNNIPADLARLDGVRMVTAIEANFNRHLDEAKIKAMTGGEPIVARFMRQNYFQFVPVFKLCVWQMMSGPGLGRLVRRLWPMQLAICLGTWAGASLMAGSETAFASAALGIALIAYAAFGLMDVRLPHVPAWAEWWLGTFVGGATGIITAATGVFVIPAVPYLQALSFEREEFMQALGLSFTVSTIALAWSLVGAGTLNLGTGLYSLLSLVPALAGMIAGQHLLRVMRPEIFRRWFFSGLALLGVHLAIGVL